MARISVIMETLQSRSPQLKIKATRLVEEGALAKVVATRTMEINHEIILGLQGTDLELWTGTPLSEVMDFSSSG